jgi:hypothetical protein
MFRCSTSKCNASISLKIDETTQEIKQPLEIVRQENLSLVTVNLQQQLEMTSNQQKPIQQLYEKARST